METVPKLVLLITLVACALSVLHAELKEVVFAPQWIPQNQFAGFYVAKEKGFYEDEGLDVKFKHMGINSNKTSLQLLQAGQTDIAGLQLLQAIAARAQGDPIVNVGQITQISGLWVVAHRPIREPKDLNHMHVARWQFGHSELFDVLCHEFNLDLETVPFSHNLSLFTYDAVDATLCYSYNEYLRLLLAIGRVPEENVLRCHDHLPRTPEDGLYVSEEYYKANKATIAAFMRATKKGWDYAAEHMEEACTITHRYIESGHVSSNPAMERLMLKEFLRLQVNPTTGTRDYAQVPEDVFNKLVDSMFRAALIKKPVRYDEMIRHE